MRENILLIVLDAVRKDHLSIYGYERPTDPCLSAIADDALVYENCFANSNWTPTSHGAIFTGRLPSHSGIYGDTLSIPPERQTIAEKLSDNGYRTFATAAGAHIRAERGFDRGFDEFHETYRIRPSLGFVRRAFTDPIAVKQLVRSLTNGHDNYTYYKIEKAKEWIRSGDDPFFAFLNLKTAHHPYNPPRPYKRRFSDVSRPRFEIQEMLCESTGREPQAVAGADIERLRTLSQTYPIIGEGFDPTEEEIDIVRSWYDGAIRYLDSQIESLFSFLDNRNLLAETNVIVTADHGDMFGEHGLEKHQYSLYEELLRVPLLIRTPSGDSSRIDEMVSLADLYPTVLRMAGIPDDDYELTTDIVNQRPAHEHLYAEVGRKASEPITRNYPRFTGSEHNGPLQSVRDQQYKLIHWGHEYVELYDWRTDSKEEDDLSDARPDTVRHLETQLTDTLGELSRSAYDEEVSNKQLEQQLKDLGYL